MNAALRLSVNIQFWLVIHGWDESTVTEASEYSVALLACQNAKFKMEVFLIFPSLSSKQTFLSVSISSYHLINIVICHSIDSFYH